MTADQQGDQQGGHTPGTGKFEFRDGLVVEQFADGSVSFDIFDAEIWPGSLENAMEYAGLIAAAPATAAALARAEATIDVLETALKAIIAKKGSQDSYFDSGMAAAFAQCRVIARAAIAEAKAGERS